MPGVKNPDLLALYIAYSHVAGQSVSALNTMAHVPLELAVSLCTRVACALLPCKRALSMHQCRCHLRQGGWQVD